MHIHVKPSASAPCVGGTLDGALVVRVRAPAARGRATAAALASLARALGARPADVRLLTGATARRKLVEMDAGAHAQEVRRRADALRLGANR